MTFGLNRSIPKGCRARSWSQRTDAELASNTGAKSTNVMFCSKESIDDGARCLESSVTAAKRWVPPKKSEIHAAASSPPSTPLTGRLPTKGKTVTEDASWVLKVTESQPDADKMTSSSSNAVSIVANEGWFLCVTHPPSVSTICHWRSWAKPVATIAASSTSMRRHDLTGWMWIASTRISLITWP